MFFRSLRFWVEFRSIRIRFEADQSVSIVPWNSFLYFLSCHPSSVAPTYSYGWYCYLSDLVDGLGCCQIVEYFLSMKRPLLVTLSFPWAYMSLPVANDFSTMKVRFLGFVSGGLDFVFLWRSLCCWCRCLLNLFSFEFFLHSLGRSSTSNDPHCRRKPYVSCRSLPGTDRRISFQTINPTRPSSQDSWKIWRAIRLRIFPLGIRLAIHFNMSP